MAFKTTIFRAIFRSTSEGHRWAKQFLAGYAKVSHTVKFLETTADVHTGPLAGAK